MTYSALPTQTSADVNSAADVNQLQENITYLKNNLYDTATKTADYTVTDTDGINLFFINPSAGNVTITLPTLTDNLNRRIKFIVTDAGGKVTIDGEGAETIGGYSSLVLQSKNDSLEIIGEAGEWQILKYHSKYDTGWINRNDWTSVTPGTSSFDYDNLLGTFIVGELITEATSGNTGIIQSDTGSTLYLKNVTGTGIWTNNRVITGATSGATADVNEAAGSNKNQDTDIFHNFSLSSANIKMKFLVSSVNDESTVIYDLVGFSTNANNDAQKIYIDSNNMRFYIGGGGVFLLISGAATNKLDTDDWYYKVVIEVNI